MHSFWKLSEKCYHPLPDEIKAFKAVYEIINMPAVHMCHRDGLSKEAARGCDLFIY